MNEVRTIACTCEQCKAVKNKRHKPRKKIKRMLSKARRKMKIGDVVTFMWA